MVQIVLALSLLFLTSSAIGGAKTIGQKKDYTLEQKIRRGDVDGSPERWCKKCKCRCHCYAPECPSCPNDICYTCDCSEKKDDIQA